MSPRCGSVVAFVTSRHAVGGWRSLFTHLGGDVGKAEIVFTESICLLRTVSIALISSSFPDQAFPFEPIQWSQRFWRIDARES